MHLVKCFEFLFSHPHCEHLFDTFSSHRDNFELHPHQPYTCLVTNVWKVLGYFAMALSYPSHQIESKCAAGTIFFSLKNLFASRLPQQSSSSACGDPVILLPPISIHTCSCGKVLVINSPVLCAALSTFFASYLTLMLMRSFRLQSFHFFESSACDCTYLYLTGKFCVATRFLNTQRRSA